jgi:hypothetical protein
MLLLNECMLFRYRLSPETFGYTLVHVPYTVCSNQIVSLICHIRQNGLRNIGMSLRMWLIAREDIVASTFRDLRFYVINDALLPCYLCMYLTRC